MNCSSLPAEPTETRWDNLVPLFEGSFGLELPSVGFAGSSYLFSAIVSSTNFGRATAISS